MALVGRWSNINMGDGWAILGSDATLPSKREPCITGGTNISSGHDRSGAITDVP
jgi:hypothetical protein